MKRNLFICILLTICSQHVFAHALWIETSPAGIKGKPHEVKIFFGEFSDKDITPAAKWFSDLKDFTLQLIGPGKEAVTLTATAKTDHYAAQFTPHEEGVYRLVMHHTVKDTYGTMKLDYNSGAMVVVGNQINIIEPAFSNSVISLFDAAPQSALQHTPVNLQAFYEGKPAGKQKIEVFAPNGWGKTLYSHENGTIAFTPLWPGKYMAEFAYTDKTPGEHNGKKYEEVWKVATWLITVK